ncbi:MAG: hypothetical protein ACXACE_00990 [Candidatus Thorarchaeota archaeon]|jgi:preprotein translocase subunit SecY
MTEHCSINVDFGDPDDRALFTGGQKVLAMFMTAFQAIAYILGNAYGTLTPEQAVIVFMQLFIAGVIVILMDELIQKGWGLGSGVSLFIMTNVAGQVMFNMLNVTEFETISGDVPAGYPRDITNLPKGIIAALISNLLRWMGIGGDTYPAVDLSWLMFRNGIDPNILSLTITFLIFFAVLYMESVRVEIPLQYAKYRGMRARYPIKLLYTSNIPVILAQALYANVLFFGQMIFNAWNPEGNNPFLNVLGTYHNEEGRMIADSGLARYITPPQGIFSILNESDGLLHIIIYAALMILLCWGFSKIWVDISGIAPRDVSRQLLDSGYIVPGFRDTSPWSLDLAERL